MSYTRPVFDYPLPFPAEDSGQFEAWNEHFHAHNHARPAATPRATVAPNELLQRSNTYIPNRTYELDPRYRGTTRDDGGSSSSDMNYMTSNESFPRSASKLPRRTQASTAYDSDNGNDNYLFTTGPYIPTPTPLDLDLHVGTSSRTQRFYCEFTDCVDPDTGVRRSVSRKADLRRHVDSVHGAPSIDCRFKKCWRRGSDGFCRPDHYRDHLRGYHNMEIPRTEKRRGS